MEKIREMQNIGLSFHQQLSQKSNSQKNYVENVKRRIMLQIQKYKQSFKKQIQKVEDQKLNLVINEYELNQRVCQLEDAYKQQQDEINQQANRNEDLKREKQLLAKKYEKRMKDIENVIQIILKNFKEEARSVQRLQNVNNSFSIGKSHHQLLHPVIEKHNQKIDKNVDQQKDILSIRNASESGKSLTQQSQNVKPASSQASVNQAFIESQIISNPDQESDDGKNNTSFFGNCRKQQNILNQEEDIQNMIYDQFKDLSMTQQEKIIQKLWNRDDMISERRDVKLEDILEISRKTINSVASSFRTGRANQNKPNQRDSDQLSILKILKGVSHIAINNTKHNKNRNKNGKLEKNSTLEISFNDNEIQVVDGQPHKLINLSDEEQTIFINQSRNIFIGQVQKEKSQSDQNIDNFLGLDEKISQRDLMKNVVNGLSESKKINSIQRQNLIQNNKLFGSVDSEDQMGGGIEYSQRNLNQNSVEEDIQILGHLFQKDNNQQEFNFPDMSLIEANNSINNQKQLDLSNTDKVGSLYSGGDSLVQMNYAFQPKKQPQKGEILTIHVQDRKIQIPKLNIDFVVSLEKREPFLQQQINKEYISSSSQSISQNFEPSSFQNESVSKQLIAIDKVEDKKQEGMLELNKAIILDELQKSNISNNQEEDNEKFDNMFASFQKELYQIDKDQQNQQEQDNTLEQNANDVKKEKKKSPVKQESLDFKKSQSAGQLGLKIEEINNQQKSKLVAIAIQQVDANEEKYNQNKKQENTNCFSFVNMNLKKIQTPKNGIKINLGNISQNQGIKMIAHLQKNKRRSNSNEGQRVTNQQQKEESNEAKRIKIINIENTEDANTNKNDKQSINIKANFIKFPKQVQNNLKLQIKKSKINQSLHSMNQQSFNEISCNQDQSLIAASFFQQDQHPYKSHAEQSHQEDIDAEIIQPSKNFPKKNLSIMKLTKRQEDQTMFEPISEESQLIQNYYSSANVANMQQLQIKQKRRPTSILKKNNFYQVEYSQRNNAPQIIATQSCEFEIAQNVTEQQISKEQNQVSPYKQNQNQKKIRVFSKKMINQKDGSIDNHPNKKRISVLKRRSSNQQQNNDAVNQTEIVNCENNQSFLHKNNITQVNASQVFWNQDESTVIHQAANKIIKVTKRSNNIQAQEQSTNMQKPTNIQQSKSIPKIIKYNQKPITEAQLMPIRISKISQPTQKIVNNESLKKEKKQSKEETSNLVSHSSLSSKRSSNRSKRNNANSQRKQSNERKLGENQTLSSASSMKYI